MSEQLKMNDLDEFFGEKIVSFGEPHLACALLLDVSGSMSGAAIDSLNNGIRRFKAQVCADPIARQRVDIAMVTFGNMVNVVSDFVPVTEMPTPILQAGGCTSMAPGINTAIDLVKKRTKLYSSLGTPCHKPWIFMITDGLSTSSKQDMEAAAKRVRDEENKGSHGHLTFWALGIDNYSQEELFAITNRVMELKDQDFTGIFDWLSESMSAISQSHIEERYNLTQLPDNARKTVKDRAIGDAWY